MLAAKWNTDILFKLLPGKQAGVALCFGTHGLITP
jgi:hypothetical protein